ncbi:hypothetical protein ACIHFB_18415 [Streptomyces sp. NPDC051963]|uniref:hypothetical protein n=1 Tax=Streptomyces sp. NPDC051963 TaxID=3365678 RepID=UPI0037CDC3A8
MRTHRNTTEVEERVRQLLGPADPVTRQERPDPAVLTRILAGEGRPRSYRPPRRHWVVGVAVVAVLGAGGLAAEATGVIPDDVVWGLNRTGHGPGSEGLAPDTDRAKMLFSGTAPDGVRMQYWSAPNPSGGTCEFVRVLDRHGDRQEGGWSSCGRGGEYGETPTTWSDVDMNALADWVTVYGRAPRGAVGVRVTWEGGRVTGPIDVGPHRYFLAFLPYDSRSNQEWIELYRTEYLDVDGRVVAVEQSRH